MSRKRVSELVTTHIIREWNIGDTITIKAGTGAGKSHFVKTLLYAYAKANNKKILFLIHRTNCIEQFTEEIKRDKKSDIIHIKTYQSLESLELKHKKKFDFSDYEYIVCDEFHYFMGDAAFNKTTDISLNMILQQHNAIKIFMSATGDTMKKYINNIKGISTLDYELDITYDFIETLTFYHKDKTLEMFIEEAIENGDKAIFFIESAEKAYSLHTKYKDATIFNCSKSNKHYKYVDVDKKNKMLKNERFEEQILITTTCLDAGVNIKDEVVKHVICDVKDIGSLIQCIGRKRILHEGDKINVYIKVITNNQLGNMKGKLSRKIKMADYLRKHTVKEYIEEFNREVDLSNIVYDCTVDEEDKSSKKINELMYYKCVIDLCIIDSMLNYKKYGYCKHLASMFNFIDNNGFPKYRTIDEDNKIINLEEYLESVLGITIPQVKDRKEIIEKIDVRSNGKLLKRINNLNGALEEREIPYRIIEFSTSEVVNGKQKKYPSAWRVEKLSS